MSDRNASSRPMAFETIVRIVLEHYPSTQAIYLFGTYGMPDEWPSSDVDLAVLLPPEDAHRSPHLMLTPCHYALQDALGKPVDLLNARLVSTVFQKEIVQNGRRLYSSDDNAVAEFEMLTLSLYQKLNDNVKRLSMLSRRRERPTPYERRGYTQGSKHYLATILEPSEDCPRLPDGAESPNDLATAAAWPSHSKAGCARILLGKGADVKRTSAPAPCLH